MSRSVHRHGLFEGTVWDGAKCQLPGIDQLVQPIANSRLRHVEVRPFFVSWNLTQTIPANNFMVLNIAGRTRRHNFSKHDSFCKARQQHDKTFQIDVKSGKPVLIAGKLDCFCRVIRNWFGATTGAYRGPFRALHRAPCLMSGSQAKKRPRHIARPCFKFCSVHSQAVRRSLPASGCCHRSHGPPRPRTTAPQILHVSRSRLSCIRNDGIATKFNGGQYGATHRCPLCLVTIRSASE